MSRQVKTYCRICEPACGLVANVDGEKVTLKPDREHPVHKGFCCHKGLNFPAVNDDPDRLNFPIARTNGKSIHPAEFERISWEKALNEIGGRIRGIIEKHGPNAVAIYYGNPGAFDSRAFPAQAAFIAKLGTQMVFSGATQDCSNKMACNELVYGTSTMHPIPDLDHTNYLLSIGCNPKVSHMSFVHATDPIGKIKDIIKRGGQVKYVNPRKIESASPATGDVVLVKPDTDVYLLAAILHTIHADRKFDEELITAHASNVDGLIEFISEYAPERVAPVVGISADEIVSIAREFSAADGASVHMSTGVNMGRQGTLAYWLVQMLSLVTGNLGKRGGNIYSPGFFPQATAGKADPNAPTLDTAFGQLRQHAMSLPGTLFSELAAEKKIKALIVLSGNPVLTMSGEESVRESLKNLELLVCVDLYRNATGELADFLLPAADWLERADVNALGAGYQPNPYVQYSDAVVPPKAERKEDWWIISSLERACGLPSILDKNDPDSWEMLDMMLGVSDLSVEKLKSLPGHVAKLSDPEPEQIFNIGIQSEDGLIDCRPSGFDHAIAKSKEIFKELLQEPESLFKLITRRTPYMHNSWLGNVEALKRPAHQTNPLYIHPDDAKKLALGQGSNVVVQNEFGTINAEVAIDDSLREGVVAMTHGWGNQSTPGMAIASKYPGVNVNKLLPRGPGSYEEISNMSFMTGVPVQIAASSKQ